MTRKGITPVVAVVLLLMMTVAAAGGAYTWVTGIVAQGQEQGSESLNRQVEVRDVSCATGGSVDFFLANTGSSSVDANDVTVYQYNVSSGDLMTTSSISNGALSPGSNWDSSTSMNAMNAGWQYRIEFEFVNEDGYVIQGNCQP